MKSRNDFNIYSKLQYSENIGEHCYLLTGQRLRRLGHFGVVFGVLNIWKKRQLLG